MDELNLNNTLTSTSWTDSINSDDLLKNLTYAVDKIYEQSKIPVYALNYICNTKTYRKLQMDKDYKKLLNKLIDYNISCQSIDDNLPDNKLFFHPKTYYSNSYDIHVSILDITKFKKSLLDKLDRLEEVLNVF